MTPLEVRKDPQPLLEESAATATGTPTTATPSTSFAGSIQGLDCECQCPGVAALPGTPEGAREVPYRSWLYVLKAIGPGLMVCLADTDGGSLLTAAQSGAEKGYTLLLSQIILIPILFAAQELTVRLGILAKKGVAELVREHYGPGWAYAAVALLVATCVGGIISEMSVIAAVGQIWGVPLWASCAAVLLLLGGVVLSGTYRAVETVGILFGSLMVLLIPMMVLTGPSGEQVWEGLGAFPFEDTEWTSLLAANVGAVVMPWMLFYQQSAICDKGMPEEDLGLERVDTFVGTVVAQVLMAAMLISLAATIWAVDGPTKINSVEDIAMAIASHVGAFRGKVLLSLGLVGASLVAALVVSLCAAWGVAEAMGMPRSLNLPFKEARLFYTAYAVVLLLGVLVTVSGVNLVSLNLCIETLNSVFMPVVVLLIFMLASSRSILPERHRLRGWYKGLLGCVFSVVSLFSLYCAASNFIN